VLVGGGSPVDVRTLLFVPVCCAVRSEARWLRCASLSRGGSARRMDRRRRLVDGGRRGCRQAASGVGSTPSSRCSDRSRLERRCAAQRGRTRSMSRRADVMWRRVESVTRTVNR
jgi:hypothetical protein